MENEVRESVDAAKSPKTFNIVDFVKNRAYPKDEVSVYLDEGSAYRAARIKDRIDELVKGGAETQDEIDSLVVEREKVLAQLNESKYLFKLTGISEGQRDELVAKASTKFPLEYTEDKNPFSGESKKVEVENKERDRYFTVLTWEACIEKVVNPAGEEQTDLTFEDVEILRESLPLAAVGAITNGIERLRLSTAIFLMEVDNEDFLAKP